MIEKEAIEIDQDVAQIFKIFFDISEKAKASLKDVLKKDLRDQEQKFA